MKDKASYWHPAETFFALLLVLATVWLLSELGEQVVYAQGKPFYKQPGLWSTIGLVGMLVFGAFYLLSLWERRTYQPRSQGSLGGEVLRWMKSLEYLAWFMAYVFFVPMAGYLIATLIFLPLLVFRMGYRGREYFLSALICALSIVIVFKSLLQVKIPGGQLYEYLPSMLRNFFIIYL